MKRSTLALLLALTVVAWPVWAETGFTAVSVTDTSATTTFSLAQSSVMLCHYGADDAYFRLFTTEDTAAAATTAHTLLVAGTPTAPSCVSFGHNSRTQGGLGWGAVALVADTGETATVHVITE